MDIPWIKHLNESKIFAGIIIIMLNIGGKYLPVTLNRSTEMVLRSHLSKDLIVFAMAWMGTRDVKIAFALTCLFVLITDYLLNDESKWCIIPKQVDLGDGKVSLEEYNQALMVVDKYKTQERLMKQHDVYLKYFNYSEN